MTRTITSLRGRVRHGDLGAPAVDAQGAVQATIFAARVRSIGGFGVPADVVRAKLDGAGDTGLDRRLRSLTRAPMAKLIYSAIASLDGYVADEDGNFDWAEPDEEVHAFVNDLERPIGTYLYGRRMYEVMVYLGDRGHLRRPAAVRAGLRGDLAGGRQGRLLPDAGDGVQRQDADRAGLRPRGGPADEGVGGT